MKMNNGHYRHYLCQQKSLPNHYDGTTEINRQYHSDQDNHLAKLKYFDACQMNVNNYNGTPPSRGKQSLVEDPAFTIRRQLLNAKEDNIQIEQMKKVKRRFYKKKIIKKIFVFRQLKNV
jgi:hypothetical protein